MAFRLPGANKQLLMQKSGSSRGCLPSRSYARHQGALPQHGRREGSGGQAWLPGDRHGISELYCLFGESGSKQWFVMFRLMVELTMNNQWFVIGDTMVNNQQ